MSRARHKEKRAMGGGVKPDVYAGEGSNVLKEAMERKRGGKVMHGEGEEAKMRADRRKRGGKVEHEKHRAKGGRVRGEGIGSDKTPLTTAAKIKEVTKDETPAEGVESD